jgi:hypothetical protein
LSDSLRGKEWRRSSDPAPLWSDRFQSPAYGEHVVGLPREAPPVPRQPADVGVIAPAGGLADSPVQVRKLA